MDVDKREGYSVGVDPKNDDLSESRWSQVSHLVRVWWSRIEDDELAGIDGKASRLARLLQRKYDYTEYHAESQSIRWMRQHRDESEGK